MAVRSSRDVLRRLPTRVPDALAARLDEAGVTVPAADSVPAATVVLLRDHAGRLETYLLHRHSRMPFAAGMVVFPGGRVDPTDPVDPEAFDGRGDHGWRSCAVRETFEETGVRLDPAALVDWAHWITPVCEPRRYDTRFYLAALPAGQTAADVSGETVSAGWQTPAEALADAEAARARLMPPTRSVLLELAEELSVAGALAAGSDRRIEVVLPEPVLREDGWHFAYPLASAAPAGEGSA